MTLQRTFSTCVLLFVSSTSFAGFQCGIDKAYPEVTSLNVVDGQVEIVLGAYFSDEYLVRPVYRLLPDGQWTRLDDVEVTYFTGEPQGCDADMNPPLDEDWLQHNTKWAPDDLDFQQQIDACVTDGEQVWAGTSFYAAEGLWGVGAIVRKDSTSGRYHYFHSLKLKPYSTNHIARFGEQLFIGTTHRGECAGPAPGYGVMRFDFSRDYVYDVTKVCGFATRAMLEHDDKLWIATDLGLSVGGLDDEGNVRWENFVPDPKYENLMRPVNCYDLYKELLQSERLASDYSMDIGFAFEDFWQRLQRLRREFVVQYLRELHGHPERKWPEN